MSSRNYTQWQAFIGPLYLRPSDPGCWDWTNEADLALAGQSSTTIGTLNAGNIAVGHTGLDLPVFGGVWIGPNGTGQGWEYCGFGAGGYDSIYNLIREPIPPYDHNGIHSAGAQVMMWAPINTDNGRIHITKETNQALSACSWTAELSGVPRRGRSCAAIMRSTSVSGRRLTPAGITCC